MDGKSERKVAPNIYRRGKVLYYRQGGKRVNLRTGDLQTARSLVKEIKARKVMHDAGLGDDKLSGGFRKVSEVIDLYRKANCPKRDETPREGRQLHEEIQRLDYLDKIIGRRKAHHFNVSDCRDYAQERLAMFDEGRGHRSVDMELASLSCAFRWSAKHPRTSGIQTNPIEHYRPRYKKSNTVKHCRDFQPADAEELHKLAAWMFNRATSQVFGWQLLFASMIGQRCSEMIGLRTDGQGSLDPGFIHDGNLFLYRSETHKGTATFIPIHSALKETIKAHRQWLDEYHPDSPWWFPSPKKKGSRVDRNSLGHALNTACKELAFPPRTVHGLRSYFVNVLRSQGKADWQIALQIGHKSGGRLIVETYGEVLPIKIDWMPEGEPAWAR